MEPNVVLMLGFASLITLGVIVGFVFVVIFLAAYYTGYADIQTVIALTIGVNFLSWLISPFFMDIMFKWLYRTRKITIDELAKKSPGTALFLQNACKKHNIKVPMLRFIEDDNPTAFSFGSGIFNARMAFSAGLFLYLDEEEVIAVIAHELGHIRRRDFIIMSIAATAIQVLYEISQLLLRRAKSVGRREKDKNPLVAVGALAYLFYFIGTYLLLFLSRTREYGADEFSAHETQNPDALSRALVKIAYGIIAKPDDAHVQKLLNATRALGPYDNQAARHLGTAFSASRQDWNVVSRVLAYDLVSPWAKVLQLKSTHPLTGRRIQKLNALSKNMGKKVSADTEAALAMPVDRERLYKGFLGGVLLYFLPWILPLAPLGAAWYADNPALFVWLPASFGAAVLIQMIYRYPSAPPRETTTLELLTDLYASPIQGKSAALKGKIIGRGTAGAVLSEDVMLQDAAGLIYLNYESALGRLGNFVFAIGKVRELIGKNVAAEGWFFRDIGHHLDLKKMTGEDGSIIKSHPMLWSAVFGIAMIGTSVVLSWAVIL